MRVHATFLGFIGILCPFVLQVDMAEAECHTSFWGIQLVNHVMKTLTIGNIDSCYRTCAEKPGCQSINYHTEKSLCELNNRTIANTPDMSVANEGSAYFEIPDPIPPLQPVDGKFTEWSKWTQCLLPPCNQRRTRHRDRFCTNPPPAHGGKNCAGPYSETQNCTLTQPACPVFKNCTEFHERGFNQSGVYIDPDGEGEFEVYCDHTTAGGGWTVFQRRQDGSVDFYRGWNDYKRGFGNLEGEFWLGLDKIFRLTSQTKKRVRVDLEDFEGKSAYAEYDYFAVASEQNQYRLGLGTYSGTAGNSFRYNRDKRFSTKDRDNDNDVSRNCAKERKGAWWYYHCSLCNLNGLYTHVAKYHGQDSVNWYHWKQEYYAVKRAEMKIRPV